MKTRSYTYTVGPDTSKRLTRYLVEVIALGALLAIISAILVNSFSEQIHNVMLAIYGGRQDIFTFGTGRAFLFLIIGDLTIVPTYLVRTFRLFSGFSMKKGVGLKKKVWLTFAFVVMDPLFLVTPYGALVERDAYAWRSKFAYDVLTNFVGLPLMGGCFLWGIAVFFAATIYFLPLMWCKSHVRLLP